MCNCQQQPEFLVGNDENNPLSPLQELEWQPDKWATLNQCADCGQLWHIDIAKANEVGLCVKLTNRQAWDSLDMTQAKVQLMVNNRGGLSFDICRWKDCQSNCVKGLAFCPHHAYFEMDIKA
ncbi:metal-binding protein [Kangiella sp. TOML190]|uniref:metal-binding protein n=1 Tax=Kangiella sp. TOML190 TaxID=2931351 RepID=UPI00203BB214|nr:metal-binding protein [Kangiella sp. TOML190]